MLKLATFQQELKKICPDFISSKFLLAVSGGADSMVLFHLFKNCELDFQVAHVNYGLRGADSDLDEELVQKTAQEFNIPYHLCRVPPTAKPGNSVQIWARNIRYEFFKKIRKQEKLDFIVTAHHLNDELETFIINLSKASGIKGLSGIPANENNILRPLLRFSKQEIYRFAAENSVQFREDASNFSGDYLRNKIRNEIVPHLLETNADFLGNFGKSLSYLKQSRAVIDESVAKTEKEIIAIGQEIISIKKDAFFAESPYLQFEILRKFGFGSQEEIRKMQHAETGKTFYSAEYKLLIERDSLILQPIEKSNRTDPEIPLNISETEILLPEKVRMEISEVAAISWKFDWALLHFPLKLRHHKQGDYFYPAGMKGSKKISKFFKDEKIPIFARQNIWILADAEDRVVAVLPFRQDKRFIATKETFRLLKLESERPKNPADKK